MSNQVIPAKAALAAVTVDGGKFLEVEKKKDNKVYRGSQYYNAKINAGPVVKAPCYISCRDMLVTGDMLPPGDPRAENENQRLVVKSTVSNAGDYGAFLHAASPVFCNKVKELQNSGFIEQKSKKPKSLVQDTISVDAKENPGGKIEDPIVRTDLDFGVWPKEFKDIGGTPKMEILDFTTRRIVTDPVTKKQTEHYDKMKVKNPETGLMVPVTDQTAHLLFKRGAIIRLGRIDMSNITNGKSWVSWPQTFSRIVIQAAPPKGFSDEAELYDENFVEQAVTGGEMSTHTNQPTNTDAEAEGSDMITDTVVPVQTDENKISEDDLKNLLI